MARAASPAGTHVTLVGNVTADDVDAYGRLLRYTEASVRGVGRAQIPAGAPPQPEADSIRSRGSPPTRARRPEPARGDDAGMWGVC